MNIFNVHHKEFEKYGKVLEGYDFSALFEKLSDLPVADKGIVYQASVSVLEDCKVKDEIEYRGFGAMPVQIGYVGGNNKVLNCLEYHKSSEFNIALDDVVLVLGLESEIENGVFDTKNCKAFFVPKGVGVELYGTTLHYAPMNVSDSCYRVACVLPKGTNGEKPEFTIKTIEDKMCAGSNKWLMAHKESEEAEKGNYIGLKGENITFDMIKF